MPAWLLPLMPAIKELIFPLISFILKELFFSPTKEVLHEVLNTDIPYTVYLDPNGL